MKDNLAVACSGACLLHCVVTTFVVGLATAGVIGQMLASEWVHILLLLPVIVLAVLSLPSAYTLHQCRLPMILGGIGIVLLITALLGPHSAETIITAVAAVILITAHILNRHLTLKSMTQEVLQNG